MKHDFIITQIWIKRELAEKIQLDSKKRPCVLVTGTRQTDKSSLLERSFPKHNYISLDLPNLAKEASENGGYF